MSENNLITIENCCIQDQYKVYLQRIDWHMTTGEAWLVIGPNGGGKAEFIRGLAEQYEIAPNSVSVVDEATRNFLVQATLENPEEVLRPGMFVGVEVVLPAEKSVLALPSTAVSYAPYGDSVFIVEELEEEKTGKKYDEDALKDTLRCENETRAYMRAFFEKRAVRAYPPPAPP